MKPENAIEVRDVRKKFKVYYDKGSQLKERILFRKRNRYEERWVLNGISFDVKKGEAIGLIGHNGCGKSTTLKLLTRIMYPDSGTIQMRGRVSSLIELGAGFHPDMSGRENIYTNASIFGLTKKEIDERMDDIIEFSEMEPYLDNPVRTYSSGMYMRLAFSVAINVNADILLIDEILAVGDINFQAKCFNKLREIKAEGTTIVIVSHSLGQIEQICDRTIWIHDGKIKAEGKPRDIHPQYMDFMGQKRQEISEKETTRQEEKTGKKAGERKEDSPEEKKRWGNGYARIQRINMLDEKGKRQKTFVTGSKIVIEMDYKVNQTVKNAVFGIGIFTKDGKQCYGTNTRIDQLAEFDLTKDGTMHITLDKVNLLPGVYLLDVAIESDVGNPVDYFREAYTFEMYSAIGDVGMVRLDHQWDIRGETEGYVD
ncbi:MAG TPA: ABC transporter ATP-binding protein [Candidatus Onthocola gallistercoris]|uniref:ABC transporter ATP-binding protein n=1 Tax=Candidatus Onthocola gallistercoris TaxID=2840876 RepID=A0A9D1KWV4_9FIRM|nr:ABC transporter ATP-binding protein [Candidatus Onthocola gallistercoris]